MSPWYNMHNISYQQAHMWLYVYFGVYRNKICLRTIKFDCYCLKATKVNVATPVKKIKNGCDKTLYYRVLDGFSFDHWISFLWCAQCSSIWQVFSTSAVSECFTVCVPSSPLAMFLWLCFLCRKCCLSQLSILLQKWIIFLIFKTFSCVFCLRWCGPSSGKYL